MICFGRWWETRKLRRKHRNGKAKKRWKALSSPDTGTSWGSKAGPKPCTKHKHDGDDDNGRVTRQGKGNKKSEGHEMGRSMEKVSRSLGRGWGHTIKGTQGKVRIHHGKKAVTCFLPGGKGTPAQAKRGEGKGKACVSHTIHCLHTCPHIPTHRQFLHSVPW